jgi:hypothetical protein
MYYIVEHEGPMALFKGIAPQIVKGLLVQGFLMMTKERFDQPSTDGKDFANTELGSNSTSSFSSDISARSAPISFRNLPTWLHRRQARSHPY